MIRSLCPVSSVTRWLLVVVGCAVLETAQPTKAAAQEPTPGTEAPVAAPAQTPAAAEPAPAPDTASTRLNRDTLLIPGGSGSTRPGVDTPRGGGSSSWLVVLTLCVAGAAWFWWRKRTGTPLARGGRERQIQIEESRPLGNRQYLVVAAVGDKKFLLGVTPGSIQMLAPIEQRGEVVRETV